LEDEVRLDSLSEVVKTAALLTTVSKGIGDIAWTEIDQSISAASMAVLRTAVKVWQTIQSAHP